MFLVTGQLHTYRYSGPRDTNQALASPRGCDPAKAISARRWSVISYPPDQVHLAPLQGGLTAAGGQRLEAGALRVDPELAGDEVKQRNVEAGVLAGGRIALHQARNLLHRHDQAVPRDDTVDDLGAAASRSARCHRVERTAGHRVGLVHEQCGDTVGGAAEQRQRGHRDHDQHQHRAAEPAHGQHAPAAQLAVDPPGTGTGRRPGARGWVRPGTLNLALRHGPSLRCCVHLVEGTVRVRSGPCRPNAADSSVNTSGLFAPAGTVRARLSRRSTRPASGWRCGQS